jgi:ketosteroid isomerase-like protein
MLTAADRLDILEVVTRADDAATRRDAEAYVTFFTDDALLDGEKGDHHGREQLRRAVGPIWESEGTGSAHCTLNAVVTGVDGEPNHAIVTSQLMIVLNGTPVSIASFSFITQHVVKVGSDWLIARRSVRPAAG